MKASNTVPWLLVVPRIAMGAFFLYEASNQLRKGWLGGDGLERMIRSALDDHGVLPPYRWFLEHVVLPHDQSFTALALAGELAVGCALVVGLATRPALLAALFMNVNFLLMNGLTAGGAVDAVFIALELALLGYARVLPLSADAALPRWRPTARFFGPPARERAP
jgi:uncharacterized membrane protein YphA (DoxX/SURF4 family)